MLKQILCLLLFIKGEMVAPGAYCDTLPRYLDVPPHGVSQGMFLLKTCKKEYIIYTGMYKVLKLGYIQK